MHPGMHLGSRIDGQNAPKLQPKQPFLGVTESKWKLRMDKMILSLNPERNDIQTNSLVYSLNYLKRFDSIEKVFIFGSYSRDDYSYDSDVDILCIFNDDAVEDPGILRGIRSELMGLYPPDKYSDVDVLFYNLDTYERMRKDQPINFFMDTIKENLKLIYSRK